MANRLAFGTVISVSSLLVIAAAGTAQPDSEFSAKPTWQPASADAVAAQLNQYLTSPGIAADRRTAAREDWSTKESPSDASIDLLDRLATALSKADDRVAALVERCNATAPRGPLADFSWLADSQTPLLIRNNMRLYLARWLVQEGFYDDAISWTAGLTPADVVAPEALLFYRAIAHQRLVEADKAASELSQLMTRREELPVRYQKLADLMVQDLAALEDESLDHIARRMEDVRRRLALGSSGERVQKVEQGVIDSLDKLIKDIEDQLQRQQSSGAGQSSGQPSGAPTPMKDSQIAELKAPGKVEHRDVGEGSGWGNLPEKEREKALQDIGRDFPAHYREVIEEYFRQLAAEAPAGGR
jgi:hypothetical protein